MPVTIAGCTYSGTLPSGSTSYIQNTLSPTTTGQQFSVQDASASFSSTLGYIGGTQCLHTVNGAVLGTGADCGSGTGGGGSAFSLAITTGGPNAFSGVAISSSNSTTEILFDSATTNGLKTGGTYYFTLNSGSVTLQGNNVTFQMVGLSTASLQTQITATALSTQTLATAVGLSTASLQTQITATALSTQTLANAVGLSTASLQTQITATGVSTGSLAGNFPVSLSTNTMSTLSASTQLSGTLQAAQEPAHTGDVRNSAGSLTLSAYPLQPNITTFTSSITVTNLNGMTAQFAVLTATTPTVIGSGTGFSTPGQVQMISNGNNSNILSLSTSTTGLPIMSVSTAVALAPSDFLLTVSSAQGGSSSSAMAFGIQNSGHLISSGTTPSMGTCGTLPVINGTDNAGIIIVGAGVVTSCTMNFAYPFSNPPVCVESTNSTSITADISSISTTAITFGFSATLGSGTLWYVCMGQKG